MDTKMWSYKLVWDTILIQNIMPTLEIIKTMEDAENESQF